MPTGTDASARADEVDEVRLAHQLVDQARDLLDRAVIHARERGVSWEAIGDAHGGITRQSAQQRYAPAVAAFNDALTSPGLAPGSCWPPGCRTGPGSPDRPPPASIYDAFRRTPNADD